MFNNLSISNSKESGIKQIRTIHILINVFTVLLTLDIFFCAVIESWLYMYSSIFLVVALLISRLFLRLDWLEAATIFIVIAFYIIAVYHATVLNNPVTSYFILLIAPLLTNVILSSPFNKVGILITSCVLFFICNYGANLPLQSNYFFFFGLFPSFISTLYFYNRLQELNKEKNILIDKLKYKNEEMVLFSQMMSHDLKAPLRSIEGFSFLLQKRQKNTTESEKELFGFIINGAKTMSQLIDNILTFFKASTQEYAFQIIDLDQLVEAIKLSFQFKIKQKSVIINKVNLNTITANKETITTLFHNLISNAIKYQPTDDPTHIPTITIEQKENKHYYQVIFRDNGIGIETENVSSLFQPFRRFHSATEYEGTGLGLSICKKILEKHHGTIKVLDTNSNGTSFLIEIAKTERNPNKKSLY